MLLWVPALHEPYQVVRYGADHPQSLPVDPSGYTDPLHILPPGWEVRGERHPAAFPCTGLLFHSSLGSSFQDILKEALYWSHSEATGILRYLLSASSSTMELLSLDLKVSHKIAAAAGISRAKDLSREQPPTPSCPSQVPANSPRELDRTLDVVPGPIAPSFVHLTPQHVTHPSPSSYHKD